MANNLTGGRIFDQSIPDAAGKFLAANPHAFAGSYESLTLSVDDAKNAQEDGASIRYFISSEATGANTAPNNVSPQVNTGSSSVTLNFDKKANGTATITKDAYVALGKTGPGSDSAVASIMGECTKTVAEALDRETIGFLGANAQYAYVDIDAGSNQAVFEKNPYTTLSKVNAWMSVAEAPQNDRCIVASPFQLAALAADDKVRGLEFVSSEKNSEIENMGRPISGRSGLSSFKMSNQLSQDFTMKANVASMKVKGAVAKGGTTIAIDGGSGGLDGNDLAVTRASGSNNATGFSGNPAFLLPANTNIAYNYDDVADSSAGSVTIGRPGALESIADNANLSVAQGGNARKLAFAVQKGAGVLAIRSAWINDSILSRNMSAPLYIAHPATGLPLSIYVVPQFKQETFILEFAFDFAALRPQWMWALFGKG